jgi:hypothetical protein
MSRPAWLLTPHSPIPEQPSRGKGLIRGCRAVWKQGNLRNSVTNWRLPRPAAMLRYQDRVVEGAWEAATLAAPQGRVIDCMRGMVSVHHTLKSAPHFRSCRVTCEKIEVCSIFCMTMIDSECMQPGMHELTSPESHS